MITYNVTALMNSAKSVLVFLNHPLLSSSLSFHSLYGKNNNKSFYIQKTPFYPELTKRSNSPLPSPQTLSIEKENISHDRNWSNFCSRTYLYLFIFDCRYYSRVDQDVKYSGSQPELQNRIWSDIQHKSLFLKKIDMSSLIT